MAFYDVDGVIAVRDPAVFEEAMKNYGIEWYLDIYNPDGTADLVIRIYDRAPYDFKERFFESLDRSSIVSGFIRWIEDDIETRYEYTDGVRSAEKQAFTSYDIFEAVNHYLDAPLAYEVNDLILRKSRTLK